ncbi:MAG: protein-export chaperone SecB, partial [Alphaproteobacteria bacterium]
MASDATGNGPLPGGPGDAQAEQQGQAQQLLVNAQYIKDLSFENPRAPNSLRPQTTQPQVEINVDVRAQNLGPDTFEVVLTIKSSAKIQEEALFLVELAYAGVVTVRNVPQ